MRILNTLVLAGFLASIAAPAFAADHQLGTSRTHATAVKKKEKKKEDAGEKKEEPAPAPTPAPAPAPQQ